MSQREAAVVSNRQFATLDDLDAILAELLPTERKNHTDLRCTALKDLRLLVQKSGTCSWSFDYAVANSFRVNLRFEATAEDDGSCVTLKTPYDDRGGGFEDLSGCLIDEW